ncbi:hypothetical protein DWB61_11635 [Ancylomarina euxinus]|uniref:Uncharacterized protein n=1 Tax=Ancylomarina euxinus TaxID=2283627 RepID=A0A425XZG2_9BACT|nr:hypothetical protein [Ancylomarina euxinus]MCZ4695515.1 hypothetical protein [Ancylomarina euxinus]MUP15667.1 hypothetical protein [Ancylomarina euxinus]RRG20660.1 hypothetical protein DWB61_11635 [Ancylomarina euxinus]
MENVISFQLSDDEKTQLNDHIAGINAILSPKLHTLIPEEKRDLPKMGDKTVAFVEKALEYGEQYPGFMPNFIDVPEARVNFETVRVLRNINTPLMRIANEIDDTMTLAGSQAYSSALSIYKVLKNAASMGQPGAKEATSELKNRFPRAKKKSTTAQEVVE